MGIKNGVIKDSKIYGTPVIVDLLPHKSNYSRWIEYTLEYLTNHNTGNKSKGAGAKAHSTYLKGVTSSKSWHFTVDDKYIIQHIPVIYNGWHCTDGSGSHSGNLNSVGIEGCMNSDGDWSKTRQNMIKLNIYLMNNMSNLVGDNWKKTIVPHRHWYNKNCPSVILAEHGGFDRFVQDCIKFDLIYNKPEPTYKTMINELSSWGNLYIADIEKMMKETGHNWPGLIEKLYYHAGQKKY